MKWKISQLPFETLANIFIHIDSPTAFTLTCRSFYNVSKDDLVRTKYFLKFGEKSALVCGLGRFPCAITPNVLDLLLLNNAVLLPRFLIQDVIRKCKRFDAVLTIVPDCPSVLYWAGKLKELKLALIKKGRILYGDGLDETGHDHDLYRQFCSDATHYVYGNGRNFLSILEGIYNNDSNQRSIRVSQLKKIIYYIYMYIYI